MVGLGQADAGIINENYIISGMRKSSTKTKLLPIQKNHQWKLCHCQNEKSLVKLSHYGHRKSSTKTKSFLST